jgi:hypothetical protein
MPNVSLFRRITGLALTAAGLILVAGCSEGADKQAPPPNITVNPPAAPPKVGTPTNAGPGSGGAAAATDSTLRH